MSILCQSLWLLCLFCYCFIPFYYYQCVCLYSTIYGIWWCIFLFSPARKPQRAGENIGITKKIFDQNIVIIKTRIYYHNIILWSWDSLGRGGNPKKTLVYPPIIISFIFKKQLFMVLIMTLITVWAKLNCQIMEAILMIIKSLITIIKTFKILAFAFVVL